MCMHLPIKHRKLTGTCFLYGRRTASYAHFDSLTFLIHHHYFIHHHYRDSMRFACILLPSLLLFKRQKNYATQSLDSKLQVIFGVYKQRTCIFQIENHFYERKKDLHVLRKCKSPAATVLCDPPHSLFQMFSLPDKRPTVKEIAFKISLLKHFRVSLFLI